MTNDLEYDTLLNVYETYKNNTKMVEDIKSQYLCLLSFLTDTPNISTEDFINQIYEISKMGDILVCYHSNVEDTSANLDIASIASITIIGSGTILYEPKIIHGCKKVGHIEDIVVHNNYRSKGIAKHILDRLIHMSNSHNCYKVILDCKSDLVSFYEQNSFENKGVQMAKYF